VDVFFMQEMEGCLRREEQPMSTDSCAAPAVQAKRAGIMSEHRSIHYSGYVRNANDFYATPHWVTDALLRHVRLRGPVWEPCCGTGAVSQALAGQGYMVVSTDIADYGGFGHLFEPVPCPSAQLAMTA
jgi:hypothetical protein